MLKNILLTTLVLSLGGCYEDPRYRDSSTYGDFSKRMNREHKKQLINLSKELHKQLRRQVRKCGDDAWRRNS